MEKKRMNRRQLVKKAQYIAPLILTLKAAPSFAKSGSENTVIIKPRRRRN